MKKQTKYQAFLLRLQRGENQPNWRAFLKDADTGETHRFATEHDLVRFLLSSLETDPTSNKPSIK